MHASAAISGPLGICVNLTARRSGFEDSRGLKYLVLGQCSSIHEHCPGAASMPSPSAWGGIHERTLVKLDLLWVLQSSAEIESPSKGIATSSP